MNEIEATKSQITAFAMMHMAPFSCEFDYDCELYELAQKVADLHSDKELVCIIEDNNLDSGDIHKRSMQVLRESGIEV